MRQFCISETGQMSTLNETYIANTSTVSNQSNQYNRSNRSNRSNQGGGRLFNGNRNGTNRGNRQKMSPDAFRTYKLKTKCSQCDNHGHWATDNKNNGKIEDFILSIAPKNGSNYNGNININQNVRSSNQQIQQDNIHININGNVLNFMVKMKDNNESHSASSMTGPFVNDGALFSAIQRTELRLLLHMET